jgi:hypothetical protein
MSTTIQYNGVLIRNVLTQQFKQECVYDQSNTDLLYHKFSIRARGYVSNIYRCPTVDVSTSVSGSTTLNQVTARVLLMEPRKLFVMTVGNDILLQVGPRIVGVGTIVVPVLANPGDLNNGPKPLECSIVGIAGTQLMPIEFSIELCTLECFEAANYSGVLNNRWSMKDSIDADFFTTRTITGRLRVADVNLNPPAFRGLVVPPLQAGFKRETIEATTTVDGLELEYTVTDKEMFASPPSPATTWEATHVVSTGDGATTHGEINATVTGSKEVDKVDLIELCARICQQKLDLLDPGTVLEQAAIIDHLESNKVEMRVNVLHSGAVSPLQLFNLPTVSLGKPLVFDGYNKDVARVPQLYGTATVTGLFVSYLQSPCNAVHGVPQTTTTPPEPARNDERSSNPRVYTYEGTLPTDPTMAGNYNSLARLSTYTFYTFDTTYTQRQNKIQLPIAGTLTPSNPSDQTCVFVAMARPTMKRSISITAQRYGSWPQIPKAQSITLGDVRIELIGEAEVKPSVPQISPDGKARRFDLECEYEYGLSRPPLTSENWEVGKIPWDTKSLNDNLLPADVFDSTLVR